MNIDIDIDNNINNDNDIKLKIFTLIKNHKYDDLHKFILNNKTFDFNIQDINQMYLLEYLIIFGKIDLIKNLLNYDLRIDIKDDSNRSILYSAIKFNHIDIIELLLLKNNTIIGKNILDIKDNDGNFPLIYAISFQNIDIIKLILKYSSNILNKNNNGDTILHYALNTNNIEIMKLIFNSVNNINIQNEKGETVLHLAIKNKNLDIIKFILNNDTIDLNIKNKLGLSILHYVFILADVDILSYILTHIKHKINTNIQDKSGNTFFHYYCNKFLKMINLYKLIKFDFNYNIYNIDGNTGLYIILENIKNTDIENPDILKIILEIIKNTDLNIQNLYGNSPLFLLIKNNFWLNKDIYNVLLTKKLDIFINTFDPVNKKKHTIFDFISNDDYEHFINLITSAYINQLYRNHKWIDFWDNKCQNNPNGIKLEELNDSERKMLKELNINTNNKNICFDIIYNKIKKYIDEYKSNNDTLFKSYPQINIYKKLIPQYNKVIISTAGGTTIDILSGLIYIKNKFDNIYTILDIINKKELIRCSNICDFNNIEIKWINKKLVLPKTLQSINEFILSLSEKDFFIIPIGIIINDLMHSNYLIFNIKHKTFHRFEPHGSDAPVDMDYDAELLDHSIENYFDKIKFEYVKPSMYLTKIGFQFKEIKESNTEYIGDPNGFCSLWCIWWCDMYLSYYDIPIKKLALLLNMEIINNDYTYRELIRNFSFNIVKIRDELLLNAKLNINDWINDKYSNQQIDNLKKYIISKII